MWHWKRTWEPLQISINRGPQPKGRGIPGDTNFLQDKLCKQGSSRSLSLSANKEALALSLSSSKEALSKSSQASFIYAWSLQRTKLCWIKPKRPIRVLQQHFEDKSKVLFKASNYQISLSSVGSSLNAP